MNKVMLIGRVAKDPIFSVTINRMEVITFEVETCEKWTDKDGSPKVRRQYHWAIQYGKYAELTRKLLKKGDLVSIEGSLNTYKKSETEWKTDIKVQIIEILNDKVLREKFPAIE